MLPDALQYSKVRAMKLTYVLISLSVITGFSLCVRYSLEQGDQTSLWVGLLMLTAVPAALYMMRESLEDL